MSLATVIWNWQEGGNGYEVLWKPNVDSKIFVALKCFVKGQPASPFCLMRD